MKKLKNELMLGNRPRILMAVRRETGKKTTLEPEMNLLEQRAKIIYGSTNQKQLNNVISL